jgi:dihydropteroate synthase
VEPPLHHPVRRIGAHTFDFRRQTAVMAIINRTPDSFFDRGATFALDAAVTAALVAAEAGADWVDIGGVPFGTAGDPVGVAEELDRVVPVVEAVRARSNVIISVDTWRTEVANAATAVGADVINDTSGLFEPQLAEVVARRGVTLVITHSLASPPRTPVPRPHYADVVVAVRDFLRARADLAVSLGVPPERIVVDPGHDLNKNTRHSLELTRRLTEITALGYPTLVALSNKDFVGETVNAPQGGRGPGSLAAAVACVLAGARIVRVHDVAATVQAVRMTEAILGWREPVFLRHNVE